MASKILRGLFDINFAAMASGPVIQRGSFELRKSHPNVGSESSLLPNFARIGTTSSQGSTSAYQRRRLQNFGFKQSSGVTRSTISRAPAVKSANSRLSAHKTSRQ